MKRRTLAMAALTLSMSMLFGTVAYADWYKDGNRWRYKYENGTDAKDTWMTDSQGDNYWLGADGVMVVNCWVSGDNGTWFYVGADGKQLKNQSITLNKVLYWLDVDGKMVADAWHQDPEKGTWYYLESDGKAYNKGWKTIDGDEYYFMKSGAMAVNASVPGNGHVGADGKRTK